MPEAPGTMSTFWLTCATLDGDRDRILDHLAAQDIEARPVWKPMHLQPIFRDCTCYGGKVAERIFAHGLCLPSGSSLTSSDLDRIVGVIRRTCAHR